MHNNLIFIGGPAHSGTSLLEYILSLHTNIKCIGDYNNLNGNIKFTENSLDIFSSKTLFDKYINDHVKQFNLKSTDYLLLKNPDNVFYLEQINKFTDNKAKIILIYRDGRDTSLSLVRRKELDIWPDFNAALIYWIKVMKIILNANNVFKLKYEDLIQNLEFKLSELHLFISIKDESKQNIIDYYNKCNKTQEDFPDHKNHVKLRQTQLLTPIYNSSRYKEELTKEQEELYNKLYNKLYNELINDLF
jgi:hypothetical protein